MAADCKSGTITLTIGQSSPHHGTENTAAPEEVSLSLTAKATPVCREELKEANAEVTATEVSVSHKVSKRTKAIPAKFCDHHMDDQSSQIKIDPDYSPSGSDQQSKKIKFSRRTAGKKNSDAKEAYVDKKSRPTTNSKVDRIIEVELTTLKDGSSDHKDETMQEIDSKPPSTQRLKQHACTECGKLFSLKCNLTTHLLIHANLRPFACGYEGCDKRFRTKETCRRHYVTHTGEKAYHCEICDKRFSANQALKEHTSIHLDTKMYKCGVCSKEFRQISSLSRHLTTHSRDKRYACEICGKRFTQAVYLRSHWRSHTGEKPYRCEECGKCYGYQSDLNRHKVIHTGQKPFSCDICGSEFNDPSSRRRHMRDHTEVRPYTCHLCNQVFRRFGLLKSHLSKRHNIVQVSVTEPGIALPPETLQIIASAENDQASSSIQLEQVQSQLQEVLSQLRQARPNTQYQLVTAEQRAPATVDELLHASRQAGESTSGVTEEEQVLAVHLAMNALQAEQNGDARQQEPEVVAELICETESELAVSSDGTITHADTVYLTEAPKDIVSEGILTAASYEQLQKDGTAYIVELTIPVQQSLETCSADRMHYLYEPDFTSDDYYNWLSNFTELCKVMPVPLEETLYEKIRQVHKTLTEMLARPSGKLCEKDTFKTALASSSTLSGLITEHLNSVLTKLH